MTIKLTNLFSEYPLGRCVIPNRIVSTGHHTYLADNVPNDQLIAYHAARAKGGAGLIISEIVAVHETAAFSANLLKASNSAAIPSYRRLVKACQAHGSRMFAQLFHPGREIVATQDGMLPVAWAPSAVPTDRFHIMPKPLSQALISDIVAGFGRTASYLAEAGFDGFEIVASHGYLPAQFLNARVNLRDDSYGGDAERRLRFLREIIASIRAAAGDRVVGLRLSGDEMDTQGLTQADVLEVSRAIASEVDYLSVVAGTSASLGGSVHIVPPMGLAHGYIAPFAAAIKQATERPVIATGRINQPQIAEQLIARGDADFCGMTRAMICDPLMAAKARAGRFDDIRACIGCNQACIGRANKSLGISCIQHPESGRELNFGSVPAAGRAKRIIVAGGGPAGMKAAAIAAARGHQVTLFERTGQLGGQARLAQKLPGREEFGGIINNLEQEMIRAGAKVVTGVDVTVDLIRTEQPDAVIGATGAMPFEPQGLELDGAEVVTAWDVLEDRANVKTSVVIADWRADWIAMGLAERLALNGCSVTLCVNAALAGETLQVYTRNHYVGRLHKLGVTILTHARLFGADEQSVYFAHTLSGEPIILADSPTLVLALGHQANSTLSGALSGANVDFTAIGDCVTPRTAEEAVFEGLQTGWTI